MPVYTVVTANGNLPAERLRQPDSNTVVVADGAEIAKIRKELPKGIDLRPFYDQSKSCGT